VSTYANLRPATAADLPAVLALVRGLADFEKLPGPDEGAERRFAADFAASPPRFRLLVAERDGALIGYALYFFTYSTFLALPSLYLEDLFVRPEHRSHGLGRAFLVELARVAVAEGCGRFEWTVLDWNVRAQSFYRSLGARILPEWHVCRVDGDSLKTLGETK
jgi:GNAT superfamily N-acetyltransferase